LFPTSAAQADELEVSRDGSDWSSTLGQPLFDPMRRWVPGDEDQKSFWVRNAGPTSGHLTLTVHTAPGDDLLDSGTVTIRARSGAGDWISVGRPGRPQSLATELGPGEQTEVLVQASYSASAGNQTQDKDTTLIFTATLIGTTGDGGPTAPATHGSLPPDGDLPGTGAPAVLWLLPLGAAAIGAGVAAVGRRRGVRRG
jgi:hypothetical protein